MVVEKDGPLTIEETEQVLGAEVKPPPERVAAFLSIIGAFCPEALEDIKHE